MTEPADADPDARVEALIRTRYPELVQAVAVMSGLPPVAEDATQEALTRALQRLRHGDRIGNLAGWVVIVAGNVARDRARRDAAEARALTRVAARLEEPQSDATVGDDIRELRAEIRRMPERQRQVTVLHYLLGYSVADTAELLSTSTGTVKNALFRSRATLAAALRAHEEVT